MLVDICSTNEIYELRRSETTDALMTEIEVDYPPIGLVFDDSLAFAIPGRKYDNFENALTFVDRGVVDLHHPVVIADRAKLERIGVKAPSIELVRALAMFGVEQIVSVILSSNVEDRIVVPKEVTETSPSSHHRSRVYCCPRLRMSAKSALETVGMRNDTSSLSDPVALVEAQTCRDFGFCYSAIAVPRNATFHGRELDSGLVSSVIPQVASYISPLSSCTCRGEIVY